MPTNAPTEVTPNNSQTTPRSRTVGFGVFALLVLLLALAFVVSLSLGSVSIPLREVVRILTGEPALKESWG
ncbi:MAG TPA: hypothetical protein PKX67_04700, partial [Anaerolineaceae bacterium]|nr:hypothetical protein [Anaerolineaceae bacterium]